MTKLRLAFIGCGDIAGYTALFARLNRKIEIVACCDVASSRAEAFARRHKIPRVFTGYRRMLAQLPARSGLDAVYLAVPHHLHAGFLQAAIEAGLHAFVEKPVTLTLEEGRQVVRLAHQRGARVAVNYQYRYDSGCFALAQALRSGALGRVYYARLNVPWSRNQDYFEKSPWHATLAQAGGGTLITQASHLLDLLLWSLDSPPVFVLGMAGRQKFAQVEVEDLALGMVALQSGAWLQVASSLIARPEQALSIEVYGEKGTAVYSDRPLPRVRFRGLRVKKEKPPVWGLHALQRSLEGFRRWVMEGQPHLAPVESALPVLSVVEAFYRSAQSGRQEAVEPVKL
jgi:predicted dehydrogenase